MKLLPLALIASTSLATTALAKDHLYVNEDQKARAERILAPFQAGEVPPMNPSNYDAPETCDMPEQFNRWNELKDDEWADGKISLEEDLAGPSLTVYRFEQALSILENRDCSCASRAIDPAKTIELVDLLPLTGALNNKSGAALFYQRLNLRSLYPAVQQFCGLSQ
ncbi:hypothetical protein [uncultured Tateyamaria sp.]|uniref:hypothetical protein n=1 Tax=uncultured Tateyamaria sp. TaxID=455651 RepID=UPI00262AA966|nr:hypothetical protein [uncultured Tateyamaria sp.]